MYPLHGQHRVGGPWSQRSSQVSSGQPEVFLSFVLGYRNAKIPFLGGNMGKEKGQKAPPCHPWGGPGAAPLWLRAVSLGWILVDFSWCPERAGSSHPS